MPVQNYVPKPHESSEVPGSKPSQQVLDGLQPAMEVAEPAPDFVLA